MKQIIAIFTILTLIACKNETKTNPAEKQAVETTKGENKPNKDVRTFRGDFIYIADGAVLKTKNKMYGVTIDEKMHELADMVAPIKKEDFDMVPVVIKGHLVANPMFVETGEGWRLNITIDEIVSVSDAPAAPDLQIEDNKGA